MASSNDLRDVLRRNAESLTEKLRKVADKDTLDRGRGLVDELRKVRDFTTMERVAEAVSRHDPKDTQNRRLYAQSLIETGHATAAVDVLRSLTQRLSREDTEWAEARGLTGRAYKQIFCDAGDKDDASARDALKRAVAAYREPFEENPGANTWHGVNLAALVHRARSLGSRVAPDLDPKAIAREVIRSLDARTAEQQDHWHHATLAEAHLALGDWTSVEQHLKAYIADDSTSAFDLAGTLRQFSEIWDLEDESERGQGMVSILRARLMEMPGGEMDLSPGEVQRLRGQPQPEQGQLEAILGREGPVTWRWWQTGLERARAVCAIRERFGGRIGTGFLVSAADLGFDSGDELLVLTNHHVVNDQGASPGLPPDAVELVFEAADSATAHQVDKVVWQSPVNQCDASALRLAAPIDGIGPLTFARALPILPEDESEDAPPRVYIIGYPGGRDLAFSFQDNELLDHEGPPRGIPANPEACRVHYRTPTEGGSSGSPVFNARLWEVIALHHMGGKTMSRLNGRQGSYSANEGIWVRSIAQAVARSRGG